MRQIVADRQAEAGTGQLLIHAFAANQDPLLLRGGKATTVIIQSDQEFVADLRQRYFDTPCRPFARVVEQIAQHFLQILFLPAKNRGLRMCGKDQLEIPLGINTPHDPDQPVEHG